MLSEENKTRGRLCGSCLLSKKCLEVQKIHLRKAGCNMQVGLKQIPFLKQPKKHKKLRFWPTHQLEQQNYITQN